MSLFKSGIEGSKQKPKEPTPAGAELETKNEAVDSVADNIYNAVAALDEKAHAKRDTNKEYDLWTGVGGVEGICNKSADEVNTYLDAHSVFDIEEGPSEEQHMYALRWINIRGL